MTRAVRIKETLAEALARVKRQWAMTDEQREKIEILRDKAANELQYDRSEGDE